jgi:hypothetical protein
MCDTYTSRGPSILIRNKSILSSERTATIRTMTVKVQLKKSLFVGLKRLAVKTNRFEESRQS